MRQVYSLSVSTRSALHDMLIVVELSIHAHVSAQKMKLSVLSYLLGQVRVLCPAWQHTPPSLDCFGDGGWDGRVLVVVGWGVLSVVVVHGGDCSCGEVGAPVMVSMGMGHVVSLMLSGQNSRILSYRYHCYWRGSSDGMRTGGNSSSVGLQLPFFKMFLSSSGDPDLSLTKTQPGAAESKCRWWSFLIPVIFV